MNSLNTRRWIVLVALVVMHLQFNSYVNIVRILMASFSLDDQFAVDSLIAFWSAFGELSPSTYFLIGICAALATGPVVLRATAGFVAWGFFSLAPDLIEWAVTGERSSLGAMGRNENLLFVLQAFVAGCIVRWIGRWLILPIEQMPDALHASRGRPLTLRLLWGCVTATAVVLAIVRLLPVQPEIFEIYHSASPTLSQPQTPSGSPPSSIPILESPDAASGLARLEAELVIPPDTVPIDDATQMSLASWLDWITGLTVQFLFGLRNLLAVPLLGLILAVGARRHLAWIAIVCFAVQCAWTAVTFSPFLGPGSKGILLRFWFAESALYLLETVGSLGLLRYAGFRLARRRDFFPLPSADPEAK